MASFQLTAEEHAELAARPVGPTYQEFTPAQIQLRLGIAQRLAVSVLANPHLDNWIKTLYHKYPPWAFYRRGELCMRIFGFFRDETTLEQLAHTATATLFLSARIDGTPLTELVRVTAWDQEALAFFRLSHRPGCFIDPLGYTCFTPASEEVVNK